MIMGNPIWVLSSKLEFELCNCKERVNELTKINRKLNDEASSLQECHQEYEQRNTEMEKLEVMLRTRYYLIY